MDGKSLISHDVLASYAADAAREVDGVRGLVGSPLPGRGGVRIAEQDGQVTVELHVGVAWGVSIPELGGAVQRRVSDYLAQMADVRPAVVDVVVDEVETLGVTTRVDSLTGATLETAPTVCHDCVWWQTHGSRSLDKRRWIERVEEHWGAWGAIYRDDDGRVLGSMQYGPADAFPRAESLPAGPPSDDAVLVTCAYLAAGAAQWVLQSLFLAAIADARDRRMGALESFAYRYPEGESAYERFRVHRTVFPRDFLADFGFRTVRTSGLVELARLELGGLQPVTEPRRERLLEALRGVLTPVPPVPQQSP